MSGFYGVAGENGCGVYDDYEKVLKTRPYVKKYKVKRFADFIQAKEYAIKMYQSMQCDAYEFYKIDSICDLNWFYRKYRETK